MRLVPRDCGWIPALPDYHKDSEFLPGCFWILLLQLYNTSEDDSHGHQGVH